MNNIVVVALDSTYAKATGIWQWDYGQILRVQGKNLPKAVEVHFSLNEKGGDSITRIGTTIDGVTDVPIPDSFLENNGRAQDYTIYAFVYLEDGSSGNTEYKITMPVKSRPKPEIPGTPEEPELFRETVKAVNAAADRAEEAEKNAKNSEEEAGKHATNASSSAEEAKKTKEDALEEVAEKKREAISAIEEQEKSSANSITNHTDGEIQRIQNQVTESETELEQTIKDASIGKTALDGSINAAGESKDDLDKSIKSATTAKTELDTSTEGVEKAKTALDGSIKTAGEKQTALDITVKAADKLDTSLKEQITTGTQLQKDLVASGKKSVQDIQDAGSEQLDEMQTVAEEFKADREQVTTNKDDISNLKEEISKNFLDDAKTKRSLDALWKLNQGISYQFETDAERGYRKDIPSGAKLASVKKIGGRTIVWNQLIDIDNPYEAIKSYVTKNGDGSYTISYPEGLIFSDYALSWIRLPIIPGHKYYVNFNQTQFDDKNTHRCTFFWSSSYVEIGSSASNNGVIITAPSTLKNTSLRFGKSSDANPKPITIKPCLYDLTKMFGAGNEPSTPEEFEALFPENYYEYNEGTLMSMPVNEVVEQGRNLLPDYFKTGEASGIISIRNGDGSLAISGTSTSNALRMIGRVLVEKGKKYKLTGAPVGGSSTTYRLWVGSSLAFPQENRLFDTGAGREATALEDDTISVNIQVMNGVTVKDLTFRPMLTYADKEGDFSPYRKNTYPIPQAILDLDGYGDGVSDDVYNYVDWENKKYHKQVGKYTINGSEEIMKENTYWVMTVYNFEKPEPVTLKAISLNFKATKSFSKEWGSVYFRRGSDGFVFTDANVMFAKASEVKDYFLHNNETIYYKLAEEQIIDISDIIDNMTYDSFEVEAGGTLTFKNSNGDGYKLPVPTEEEYIVSLAEVGGDTSNDGSTTQNDG